MRAYSIPYLDNTNNPGHLYLECGAEPLGRHPGLGQLEGGELLAIIGRSGAGEDARARRHGVNPDLDNIQPIRGRLSRDSTNRRLSRRSRCHAWEVLKSPETVLRNSPQQCGARQ